jgi:hypothetical protein
MSGRIEFLTAEVEGIRERERPREVIDLTGDDEEGVWAGENEEPLMVRVERAETVIPETPEGTLVELGEDDRSTPQVVGEAERLFERMNRAEEFYRPMDEEADELYRTGRGLPEYEDAPEYYPPAY